MSGSFILFTTQDKENKPTACLSNRTQKMAETTEKKVKSKKITITHSAYICSLIVALEKVPRPMC